MRKTTTYRVGEWRRELMADELQSIDKAELEALSQQARMKQEKLAEVRRR